MPQVRLHALPGRLRLHAELWKLPRRIVSDVRVTLNSVDRLTPKVATRLLSSCSVCGLCDSVCTEHIDMGRFLLDARRIMHREGALPPVFHDFWLRDLAFSQSDRAYLARNAPGEDTSDHLFFPGVSWARRTRPTSSGRTGTSWRDCRGRGSLGCCGIPAEWAGDEPLAAAVTARASATRGEAWASRRWSSPVRRAARCSTTGCRASRPTRCTRSSSGAACRRGTPRERGRWRCSTPAPAGTTRRCSAASARWWSRRATALRSSPSPESPRSAVATAATSTWPTRT